MTRYVPKKEGNTRIVKRFLLFPVELDNEGRWFEWAYIFQKCETCMGRFSMSWKNVRFSNESEYQQSICENEIK